MNAATWLLIVSNLVAADAPAVLPGTQPLAWEGDLPLLMVDDLHAFADRATAASVAQRARHWRRDFASRTAYEQSVEPNRRRLAKYLGVDLDRENRPLAYELLSTVAALDQVDDAPPSAHDRVVRWPVLPGLNGYAVTSAPRLAEPRAVLIFVGDPAFGPLTAHKQDEQPTLRSRLHQAGCASYQIEVVDRRTDHARLASGKRTNQTHREFIFRQAFEMGRHVLGYEVEHVLSLIDWLRALHPQVPIGVLGSGEGGRVALLAAALDRRIDVVGVVGAFGSQQRMWQDPIDRTIWGYLDEFGDAEAASLIAPRRLLIAPAACGRYDLPPPGQDLFAAAAPGELHVPTVAEATAELARAKPWFPPDREWSCFHLVDRLFDAGEEIGLLSEMLRQFKIELPAERPEAAPDAADLDLYRHLQRRLVPECIELTQALVRQSEYVRNAWWKEADRAARDPAKWQASCAPYRKHLYDEVLGRFELPMLPPNARTRKIYDEPTYAGYEVVLDVLDSQPPGRPGVWAYGILLVPKDIPPGERRPVVVCQHGLEGRPQMLCEPGSDHKSYHRYAGKLAERGFVTFAPQNPYIGGDHFRQLVRKLWPLKKTLWSVIVPQHEQITAWLASLPFVDPERIGFYGLSYGGKTAMRVPALVDRYCLSICSGDFNEWIRKITDVREPFSYMGTKEYEIMEFDLGHTFNYAELAGLIAPRPFMVERGHRDGVGIDPWVAYEYAKVQLLYADLKIPERTEIEYFDGPHTIHGAGTFEFLHRHLRWPAP